MNKTTTITFILLLPISAVHSQQAFTEKGLEAEVLSFYPERKAGVSEASFDKAMMMLDGTRDATKGDPAAFNVADYWNVAVAFCLLDAAAKDVSLAFGKAARADATSLCKYIEAFGGKSIQAKIPEQFNAFVAQCSGQVTEKQVLSGGDSPLTALMREINSRDQRYRAGENRDLQKQAALDRQNEALIDSLFTVYGSYIGNQLVEHDLEHVMWAVIQHSNLEMMEKYLPIVHKATKQGHLSNLTPLKMLIDRIYSIKTGVQIFGSQQQVPLAGAAEREQVADHYGL